MIAKSLALFFGLLMFASPAFCNSEKAALWAYFDALSKGDVKQLKTLLSPDFEYDFYQDNKPQRLSRADELKSIELILNDLPSNQFDVPDLFFWNVKAFENLPLDQWNKVQIKLSVFFQDSPKVYTETIFRGADLELDETLIVTLNNDQKISKIVEMKRPAKRTGELSFGYLKQIYLKDTESDCRDDKRDFVCTLKDKPSGTPLLIRVDKEVDHAIEVHYYWPNKRPIRNLGF